jgi:hypothetical protein
MTEPPSRVHAENSGFRNELALRRLRFNRAGRSMEANTGGNSPTLLISGIGFENPTHALRANGGKQWKFGIKQTTRTPNAQATFLTEPSAIKPRLSWDIFLPLIDHSFAELRCRTK